MSATISRDQEISEALEAHNTARRLAPTTTHRPRTTLQWSHRLSASAQSYAEHLAATNTWGHSPKHTRPDQGENLYCRKSSRSETTFAFAVEKWVAEESRYNGEKIVEKGRGYGHYTQVVWPGTTKVGMGKARNAEGKWFVVARYEPAGNRVGKSAWDF